MTDFRGKKVGILGLGEENLALVEYLVKSGAEITVCDKKREGELGEYYQKVKDLPVQFRLGPDFLDQIATFDIIFRTPGLLYLHPKIQAAKEQGVEVSSQTKLFFQLCPCPIIGVTGTKGKGTTATLISEILNQKSETNQKVYLGGNIGNPPIGFLDKLTKDDIVVLELSSFQLQDLDKSPHIAVVLDIKVDHLDYHRDEKEYTEAKTNIVRFQQKNDFAVINADYLTSFNFAAQTQAEVFWFSRRKSVDQGTWVKNKQEFILRANDQDSLIAKTNEVTLRGEHNLENIAAAITAAYLAGADVSTIIQTVKDFRGLEHRLEFVLEEDGVKFYNDSFSTTPDTTIAAIRSFKEPIILLIGGSEKNAHYDHLGQEIARSSVKAMINIGQTGQKIIQAVGHQKNIEIISEIQELSQAVAVAKKIAQKGDVVLLSPASASFDFFKNYKQRGQLFKEEIKKQ